MERGRANLARPGPAHDRLANLSGLEAAAREVVDPPPQRCPAVRKRLSRAPCALGRRRSAPHRAILACRGESGPARGAPSARLRPMDTMEVLLAVIGVFTVVFGVVLTFIGSLILHRLKAVEERAKEDRAANKADHDRLFQLVAGLQADMKVLRDRSGRSDRSDSAADGIQLVGQFADRALPGGRAGIHRARRARNRPPALRGVAGNAQGLKAWLRAWAGLPEQRRRAGRCEAEDHRRRAGTVQENRRCRGPRA